MDYTEHVGWFFKRRNFWTYLAKMGLLFFTIFGPLCYSAEITRETVKKGAAEAEMPQFSFENCCSRSILLWICWIVISSVPALLGVVFVFLDYASVAKFFTGISTLLSFIYLPSFLICAASGDDSSSVYGKFFSLPWMGLPKYYGLAFIYAIWTGAVSAVMILPVSFVMIGIAAIGFQKFLLAIILLVPALFIALMISFAANAYAFASVASLIGTYMRTYKEQLLAQDIVKPTAYLMDGSFEE
ncbi:MAG: hypothetical protein ACI38Q_09310 [Candidatus Bruticola sp.]